MRKPIVTPFLEEKSNTFSYVVQDPSSNHCVIIDSVLDFDYPSGVTGYQSADAIIAFVEKNNLVVDWLQETHIHADHLSAAPYIQQKLGGKLSIGTSITTIQDTFGKVFNEGSEFERNGSQFDCLLSDNETYYVGNLECTAMATPGHTPACMTYIIGDAVFVGDTLFMPDSGTARADFPGGDAGILFDSITRILQLPEQMRVFVCHDYGGSTGRALINETTIAQQKKENIHVGNGITREEFIKVRTTRDKTLSMPTLIFPSLQVNMRAGHFPKPENDKAVFLKVPINAF